MDFEKELEIDKSFHLVGGKILSSLKDLKNYVHEMPDEVYNHHVRDGKNDFAEWIKGCLELPKLAASVKQIKKKDSFVKKVLEYTN